MENETGKAQLKAIIIRIERMEEDKTAISDEIKEIYNEAKGNGFDVKTIKKVVALRKIASAEREEQEYILNTYLEALGMA